MLQASSALSSLAQTLAASVRAPASGQPAIVAAFDAEGMCTSSARCWLLRTLVVLRQSARCSLQTAAGAQLHLQQKQTCLVCLHPLLSFL